MKSLIASLAVGILLAGCIVAEPSRGPVRGDRDHDGVPNRADRDRDGDGVPNREDRRPNDPSRY